MSTVKITGMPAEYKNGMVTIVYRLAKSDQNYLRIVGVAKLPEIVAAVEEARQTLAGTESMIFVRVVAGRKPNGFDKWQSANRSLFEIRKEAA